MHAAASQDMWPLSSMSRFDLPHVSSCSVFVPNVGPFPCCWLPFMLFSPFMRPEKFLKGGRINVIFFNVSVHGTRDNDLLCF